MTPKQQAKELIEVYGELGAYRYAKDVIADKKKLIRDWEKVIEYLLK